MNPQRAQALEAELRRLADQDRETAKRFNDQTGRWYVGCAAAYNHAADLVRDAAKEG